MNAVFNVGLELTWLPKKRGTKWQEFRNKEEACKVAAKLNDILVGHDKIKAVAKEFSIDPSKAFVAKGDTFRSLFSARSKPNTHEAWCIEVNNFPFPASYFTKPNILIGESPVTEALIALYEAAKSLGLHPCVTRRSRDGTVLESPTCGGHLHASLSFWEEGAAFFPALYLLEYSLCMDFVNYPFIRWLFAQWMDDTNSYTAIEYDLAKKVQRLSRKSCPEKMRINETGVKWLAHEQALKCHSIKQRAAVTGKPALPTWEFRFFDMPRTVDELSLQVKFLQKWLSYRVNCVQDNDRNKLYDEIITYDLTPAYYKRLTTDLTFARKEISAWFTKIGLDFAEYEELCWDRAYVKRMKYNRPK